MVQEKSIIQDQYNECMNQLSQFKIFKEKLDIDYQNQLRTCESKINSLNAVIQEKENQVNFNLKSKKKNFK